MEKQRLQLYTDSRRIAKDKNMLKDYDQKYKNYSDWDSKNFGDETLAKSCWANSNKNGSISNQMTWNEFLKNYACDLDWAKDQEYCKVAPKQDQWLDLEEDNKSTFIEEFPCIASLISGKGRQKMYPEGMVFLLPVNFEGRKCNVYMLNSGDETKSKWDGLIIDRATKERGQFKCEGDEGNSSSNLDIE